MRKLTRQVQQEHIWANSGCFFQLCQCVKYNGIYSVLRQKVTWDWGWGGGPKNSLVFSPLPALQMYNIIWFFMFTYVASTFHLFMWQCFSCLLMWQCFSHLLMWQHFSRLLMWQELFIYLCGSTFHVYLCGKSFSFIYVAALFTFTYVACTFHLFMWQHFSHLLMWQELFTFTYVARVFYVYLCGRASHFYLRDVVWQPAQVPPFCLSPCGTLSVSGLFETLFEALLGRTRAGSNKSLAGNELTVSVWKGIF